MTGENHFADRIYWLKLLDSIAIAFLVEAAALKYLGRSMPSEAGPREVRKFQNRSAVFEHRLDDL
jgi:hypothetical protein